MMWDTLLTRPESAFPKRYQTKSRRAWMIANERATMPTFFQLMFFIVILEHRETAKQSAQSEMAVKSDSIIPISGFKFTKKTIYLRADFSVMSA